MEMIMSKLVELGHVSRETKGTKVNATPDSGASQIGYICRKSDNKTVSKAFPALVNYDTTQFYHVLLPNTCPGG